LETAVERLEDGRVKIDITVPAEDVEKEIAKAYAEMAKRVRIPGFRAGKAPRAVIDRHVGRDAILAEAQESVVSAAYTRALSQHDIRPIEGPDTGELDALVPGEPFCFSVTVAVRPELTLSSVDDITVTVPPAEATDREVDAQIEYTRGRYATLESVDAPVAEDDFALISFVGTIGGEPYEGNVVDKYLYEMGKGLMPEEFETALVGATSGDSVVATFEIPEDSSNPEYVGKEARFEIEVHEVKRKVLPELDDEFAASVGGYDSMDEYRADVKARLDESKQSGHMRRIEAAAIDALVERLQGEVPEKMIESRAANMTRDFFENLEQQGIGLQQYVEATGFTPERIQTDIADQAAHRVRTDLALEAYFRQRGMSLSQNDVDEAVLELAGGDEDGAERMREELIEAGALPIVKEQLMQRKALRDLIDRVEVVEAEPEPAEAEKE